MEQIATVTRMRRFEWLGHVKRREETENINAVTEMKMERSLEQTEMGGGYCDEGHERMGG